jgi:predicted permease
MMAVLDDLRLAWRQIMRGRVVIIVTILTLAIGIASNTAMFSFLNFVFFQLAPAGDPKALVWIGEGPAQEAFGPVSAPHFRQLQTGLRTVDGVMAYATVQTSIGGGTPERVLAQVVSGNYFDVMKVRPQVGRAFSAGDDAIEGASPVVIISDATWERRFRRSPSVIGTSLVLNGAPFTVIGVAPPRFNGVDVSEPMAAFVPLAMLNAVSTQQSGALADPANRFVRVVGRLGRGQSLATVRAAASVMATQLNADGVREADRVSLMVKPLVGSLGPGSRQDTTPIFLLLAIVPLFVLLIACANAANMQLAHGVSRRRELAVRHALGATRRRLVRQLLTESVMMSLVAAVVGTVLAFWLIRSIVAIAELPAGFGDALRIDGLVLLGTLCVALFSGVVFGLLPALSVTSLDLTPALKDEGVAITAGPRRFRVRNLLIVLQVCISMVLLATAGLFLRSLDRSMHVYPGFDTQHALAASFDLRALKYSAEARSALMRDVQAQTLALPGVTAVGFASMLPLSGSRSVVPIVREGTAITPETEALDFAAVTPSYFGAMGMRLLRGRVFSDADTRASGPVAVIDARMAERLWPGENALGKRIRVAADTAALREVIGVVETTVTGALTELPSGTAFFPDAQAGTLDAPLSLVVRSRATPVPLIATVRELFRTLDPNLPLQDLMTYDAMLRRATDGQRAGASVLGVLGALALLLAALGLYGITSHSVTTRTREIGLRMALGARRAQIQRTFVTDGLTLTAIGVALGGLASLALAKVIASLLYGVGATDGVTFLLAAAVLCVVAVVASFIPARRAASVDPLVALRAT